MQPQSLEDSTSAPDREQQGDNTLSSRIAQAREMADRANGGFRDRNGGTSITVENPKARAAHADEFAR